MSAGRRVPSLSLASASPSASRTPVTAPPEVSKPATAAVRSVTPCARCSSASSSPISVPTAAAIGIGSTPTRVTSWPNSRATAAASQPSTPLPTITRRWPVPVSRARSASASSRVRRVCTPVSPSAPGSVRAATPVAMITPAQGRVSPLSRVSVRVAASSPVARVPSRRSSARAASWSLLRSSSRSGSHAPCSSCLDSGGRS